ncbi:OmpA family protein [Thaumasiovibrio sp. DFM-14]|uniref:OmpA family protein n=1 Tax=Thaumasiovibrio sp. DFM-14 TaxID=3384792 RepID=UPI0039A2A645
MNKKLSVFSLTTLMAFSVTAAQDQPFYAGARIGNAHYTDAKYDNVFSFDDRNSVAGGAFLGYNFTPYFAFEGGYTYLGKGKLSEGRTWEADGIDLLGKLSYGLTDKLDLFGKAGAFRYDNELSGEPTDTGDNGWAPTVGAGLEYYFNKALSARVEYQYYDDLEESNVHFWGLGLVYNFGAAAPVPVVLPEPEPEPEPMPLDPVVIEVEPLTQNLYFEFDSGTLTDADLVKLAPIVTRLNEYPESELYVIGHTDSSGSVEYNQTLSEERAATVAEYLKERFNITKERVFIEGRGEEQPIASNETDEGRAQNRRVEAFTPGFSYEMPQ